MRVTLSDEEVRTVRTALRMTEAAFSHLVSMSPSEEVRRMLMTEIRLLAKIDRRLL